jgi:hypothetical protein
MSETIWIEETLAEEAGLLTTLEYEVGWNGRGRREVKIVD